jgi:hypothetical protein
MRPKFIPSFVREDGTFCVIIKFTITQDAANLREQITEWCKQWIAEHQHWQRPVSESEIGADKGPWNYFEIFSGPPYVIKAVEHQLWLRFDGKVYSYWWKDWFAPMMGGLQRAIPELQMKDRFSYNCDD